MFTKRSLFVSSEKDEGVLLVNDVNLHKLKYNLF